jgi:uncharacterized SAM-binding protein YcdF (DUF218 family)
MRSPFDVVLILGKELRVDPARGRRELGARCAAASALWRHGASYVVNLEAKLRGQDESGSAVVRAMLAELGVPEAAIVLDDRTRSTREEAVEGGAKFLELGARRPVVVTARYHVPRARRLFADVGVATAIHTPEAFWRFANDKERMWMAAGIPDEAVMRRECATEAVLSTLARVLSPLPASWRAALEIRAGAAWRGVTG